MAKKTKANIKHIVEPFNTWYDDLQSVRVKILEDAKLQDADTPEDSDEMKGEYLREYASEIEDVALAFQETAEEFNQLQERVEVLEIKHDELVDPEYYGNGNECSQKLSIIYDLMDNCTIEELEALEMIMRIQKGNQYYAQRNSVPHPDNVNLNLIKGYWL